MAKQKETESTEKPYATTPGNYNRESGTKTLRLVAVMISLIFILAVTALWLIYQ